MNKINEAHISLVVTMIGILHEQWNKSYEELSDIIKKYKLIYLIETGYARFDSMGTQGIVVELEKYIKKQGGSIE